MFILGIFISAVAGGLALWFGGWPAVFAVIFGLVGHTMINRGIQ